MVHPWPKSPPNRFMLLAIISARVMFLNRCSEGSMHSRTFSRPLLLPTFIAGVLALLAARPASGQG
jgi:hypothetical protein